MSWFKDLAGRAEDFLNQIDQNAAVALQKEKKNIVPQEMSKNGSWPASERREVENLQKTTSPAKPSSSSFPSVKSLPNFSAFNPVKSSNVQSDDDLMTFLNSTEPVSSHDSSNQAPKSVISTDVSNVVINMDDRGVGVTTNSHNLTESSSTFSTEQSSRSSSMRGSPVITDQGSTHLKIEGTLLEDLQRENKFLKTELRSVNNEMSVLAQRTKAAERECANLQEELSSSKSRDEKLKSQLKEKELALAEAENKLLSSKEEIERLDSLLAHVKEQTRVSEESANSNLNETVHVLQTQITEKELYIESLRDSYSKEQALLRERLSVLENEHNMLSDSLNYVQQQLAESQTRNTNLQQQCDKLKHEGEDARSELEQYRARAQRILQDKEKLIAELRGDGSAGRTSPIDDTVLFELDHLRQERELLREEVVQLSTKLKNTRDELQEAEKKLDAQREQALLTQHTLQQNIQDEYRKRQAAEDDCRIHLEELHSAREESSHQQNVLAAKLREHEAELNHLRKQLTHRPTSTSAGELESRLHALTQTLVEKQCALETVTTEKNALRLQLEKLENKHKETVTLLQQNQTSVISVNDTDDAKCSRVPSFLVESPFDTGMTRRVKRAYSSLDAVSIRTGVFLRRYPLIRILMLCYMVLLHLWVMLVLFSYSPQTN